MGLIGDIIRLPQRVNTLSGMNVVKSASGAFHSLMIVHNYCFETSYVDPKACSANGFCVGQNKCVCNKDWMGSNCNQTTCFDFHSTNSSVCSGQGRCRSPNTCSCVSNTDGAKCEFSYCNNLHSNNETVCSKHGKCVSPNSCKCDRDYSGNDCELWSCWTYLVNDERVCGASGKCVGINQCKCKNSLWIGVNCDVPFIALLIVTMGLFVPAILIGIPFIIDIHLISSKYQIRSTQFSKFGSKTHHKSHLKDNQNDELVQELLSKEDGL